MTEENLTISGASLRRFIQDALATTGMAPADAATAADVLATADEFGVSTHGVKLLPGYLRRLNGGGARPQGRPHVLRDGPAWALVDGDSALGALIGVFGMRTAIEKAKTAGIAYVGVRNSGHFAAAGYYALMAARAGLVGISVANDTPSVIAPGAREPVVGTNPFSYAIPAGRHPPILLDMAISTVAGGKVYQARMLGKPIPDNWIVDRAGQPTSNAELYPEQASLVPAGGYKGFGLGLLIETLAGLLSGAQVTFGVASWMLAGSDKPTHHGAAFIAIDPAVLGPREEFLERVDKLIDEIHATPTAAGVDRIMVPGDREFAQWERSQRELLLLLSDVAQNVREAAVIAGLDLAQYQ
ncbi:MAG: Ldh family oxidoreductase [Anaerolineales bacterium]